MDRLDDGPTRLTYGFGPTTINTRYVAFTTDDGLLVQSLDDPERLVWRTNHETRILGNKTVLQLSPVKTTRLAVSSGLQIFIYNVETQALEYTAPGNGRTVSAIAWSQHDQDLVAVGSVDGVVSIWRLEAGTKLLHSLFAESAACHIIAFNPLNKDVLAVSHGSLVKIWSLRNPGKPVASLVSTHGRITDLAWNPVRSGMLLAATINNSSIIWDIGVALSFVDAQLGDSDSEDEHPAVFGDTSDIRKTVWPVPTCALLDTVAQVGWIGANGLLALASHVQEIIFSELDAELQVTKELSRVCLRHSAHALDMRNSYGRFLITTHSPDQSHTHEVPAVVSQHMALTNSNEEPTAEAATYGGSGETQDAASELTTASPKMKPVSASWKRKACGRNEKKRKQLQSPRTPVVSMFQHLPTSQEPVSRPPSSNLLISQNMVSSFDFSKSEEHNESPMPFLSPSIPARKSPNASSMEEGLYIPLLPESSFHSAAAIPEHDSDSDDETFAPGMNGSGTLMPGGVNVPLPKSCGALFGPRGDLVVFLPSKLRPNPPLSEHGGDVQCTHPKAEAQVAKLFPVFGKIAVQNSDSSSKAEYQTSSGNLKTPKLVVQASSFQGEKTWQSRNSPLKKAHGNHDFPGRESDVNPFERTPTTSIKVLDATPFTFTERKTAGECRVLCDKNETGTDLCNHNARISDAAGLGDAADIWHLLALLLEDSVPLEMLSNIESGESLVVIAREASVYNVSTTRKVDRLAQARISWAEHPLGAAWLVRQILGWAEQRADVQMLAYVSAILSETAERAYQASVTALQDVLTRVPSFSTEFSLDMEYRSSSQPTAQSIPTLRTSAINISPSYVSPSKGRQSSIASSRNASQPTTPHLDSSSSTPPFVFPGFSRQGSRMSASGSVSPEHQRTSFSAAAKYYAQSITDKISSYGTSPPLRRMGTSPSAVELSTSLPAGSWSKSVSFASTLGTTKDSQLSRSYTIGEDGYDSDKTIDDTSLPNTPKSNTDNVVVTLKGTGQFANEMSGGARTPLLPQDLAAKALVWRQHYAEQLRIWGFWSQAAELEKVSGLYAIMPPEVSLYEGVAPASMPGKRRPTCTICRSMIAGVQQACPSCLHTTHLKCLEEYLTILGKERFTCPAGCNCACADLPFDPVELSAIEAQEMVNVKRHLPGRPSFTDPRRWRAKIEGDMW